MQFIVISHQIWETVLALLVGTFLALSYDCVRFLRMLICCKKTEVLIANIFDVFFGIYTGAVYCIFIYYASNGRFRWFTALGMLVGFILYRLSVGRPIIILFRMSAGLLRWPLKRMSTLFIGAAITLYCKLKRKRALNYTNKLKKQLSKDIILDWDW